MQIIDGWLRYVCSYLAEGEQGKQESDNPYQKGTIEYKYWLKGFRGEVFRKSHPEVYLEGKLACQSGKSLDNNPYNLHGMEWALWYEGYNDY